MKKTIIFCSIFILLSALSFADIGDLELTDNLLLKGDEKKIYFYNSVYYLTFSASGSLVGNYSFVWPVNDGDSGQYLATDGSGVMSWSTPAGAGDMLKETYDTDEDGDIDQAAGGTEIDSSGVTNGQLLIGNTTGNVFGLSTITGTANQITVTNAASSITLSAPQDIATTSSPTFDVLSLDTLKLLEQSANPTEPSDGEAAIWLSDGTQYGDAGDVMIASNSGGTTMYGTLFDYSGGTPWTPTDVLLLDDGSSTLLLDDGSSNLLIRP